MIQTLEFYYKKFYGHDQFYPDNDAAKIACILCHRKSLNLTQIKLYKELGHDIKLYQKPVDLKSFLEPVSN